MMSDFGCVITEAQRSMAMILTEEAGTTYGEFQCQLVCDALEERWLQYHGGLLLELDSAIDVVLTKDEKFFWLQAHDAAPEITQVQMARQVVKAWKDGVRA